MKWSRALAAGLGVVGLLATASCAGRLPAPVALPPVASSVTSDAALSGFYDQPIGWVGCAGQVGQCATLAVPRDYTTPRRGRST